ncbi:MAG: PAS domain-containing protein [Candidatus Fibromonas sp.]|jgi:PAS domain S-box-containing protein|nr:PAS domain-containing protein [Candidatus Fibromonas sp.]
MKKLMGWWEINTADDSLIAASDSFWNTIDYTEKEIGSKRSGWIAAIVWPEDQEKLKEIVNSDIWEVDFRIKQKDGSSIWLRETGRWLEIENGKPKRISGVVKNVTIEKRSFERMESRERESAMLAKESMDLCPIVMALFEVKSTGLKLLEMNEVGIKLWQFTSYQNAAENIIRVVSESIPPYQPNGSKSVTFSERIADVMMYGSIEFETFLTIRGKDTYLKIHIKKIDLPNKTLAIVYMMPK